MSVCWQGKDDYRYHFIDEFSYRISVSAARIAFARPMLFWFMGTIDKGSAVLPGENNGKIIYEGTLRGGADLIFERRFCFMRKWGHIFGDVDCDGDVDYIDVLIAEENLKKPTPIIPSIDDDDDDDV